MLSPNGIQSVEGSTNKNEKIIFLENGLTCFEIFSYQRTCYKLLNNPCT